MAKQPLKNHENMEQMRTVQRAIERVSSWPQWKRSSILFRSPDTMPASKEVGIVEPKNLAQKS